MINYIKMEIEGFAGVAKPFVLEFTNGINLVSASNGTGKTTIFSAIIWAEFGIFSKKNVATWKDKRDEEWRGTRVILTRQIGDVTYKVCRHLNFKGKTFGLAGNSTLVVFASKDGKFTKDNLLVPEEGISKRNVQDMINNQLGMDSMTFTNSVFMQQRASSLLEVSDADKRKLFLGLINTDFIDLAIEKAKKLLEESKEKVVAEELAVSNLNVKLDSLRANLGVINKSISTEKESRSNRLKEIRKKYNNIKDLFSKSKESLSDINREIEKLTIAIDEIDLSKVEQLKEAKNNLVKEYDSLQVLLRKEYKEKYDSHVEMYDDSIAIYLTHLSELQVNLRNSENQIKDYESRIKSANKKKKELEQTDIETHCGVCGNPLNSDEVQEARDSLAKSVESWNNSIVNLKKDLQVIEERKSGIDKEIATTKELKQQQEDLKSKVTLIDYNTDSKLVNLNTNIQKIDTELQDLKNLVDSKQSLISVRQSLLNEKSKAQVNKEQYKRQANELQSEYKLLKDKPFTDFGIEKVEKEIADTWESLQNRPNIDSIRMEIEQYEWWIKKGFGNRGLKSYIFGYILSQLNNVVLDYAHKLGIQVRFEVDYSTANRKVSIIVEHKEGERDYSDLSGGEKRRVDICILFAMNDFVQSHSGNEINIFVMDEPLAGLDAEAVEVFFQLLKTKSDKCVYLMSHKELDTTNANVLELKSNDSHLTIN